MKKIQLLLALLFISIVAHAQRHELGVRLGMNHLVGDIGRTNFLIQKPFTHSISEHGVPLYTGLIYRRNFNPYQSLRVNLGYSQIQFDDAYAKELYRKNRRYKGTNSGADMELLFEYNFFPVNNEQKSMLSPYIFGGLGAVFYHIPRVTFVNDFERNSTGEILPPDATGIYNFTTTPEVALQNKMIMSVPFGAGLKYKFNYNWALSGEFTFRPTFSDGIDYSRIENKDTRHTYNKEILQPNSSKSELQQEPYITTAKQRAEEYLKNRNLGNPNSKDWINSITISLTYSFGRPPCYCD